MASVGITTSGSAKELGSVANEPVLSVDIRSKVKNEHVKINAWENGKHVSCHSK